MGAARLGLTEDWLNDSIKGLLPGTDRDDIGELARICGLKSAEAILDVTLEVMDPRAKLLAKVRFLIEEAYPSALGANPGPA